MTATRLPRHPPWSSAAGLAGALAMGVGSGIRNKRQRTNATSSRPGGEGDGGAEKVNAKTSASLMFAKWYLLPLLLVTAWAYHCWYQRLYDRGFGLIYNATKRSAEFGMARLLFGILGVGGLILLERFRKGLPWWMRSIYFLVVAAMITFFAVDWIIVHFGPEPYWHHP